MNTVIKLSRESAALAVIDMQEAFRPVMGDFANVASNIATAVEGARLLELPVIVTEQYPKGLKHTAEEILARLPKELNAIEKSCFSSCGASEGLGASVRPLSGSNGRPCLPIAPEMGGEPLTAMNNSRT